jgi:hypothetical protein
MNTHILIITKFLNEDKGNNIIEAIIFTTGRLPDVNPP